MKYLVNFIGIGNKSSYDLIICENHSPDISGMITLNKCFVLRKTWDMGFVFRQNCNGNYEVYKSGMYGVEIRIPYREEEEIIIVNREDIRQITSIKDEEVDGHIPNLSYEEALIKTNEEVEKTKIEAQKRMDKYNANKPIDITSNINEIPKNIDNWFTKLIKRSKV